MSIGFVVFMSEGLISAVMFRNLDGPPRVRCDTGVTVAILEARLQSSHGGPLNSMLGCKHKLRVEPKARLHSTDAAAGAELYHSAAAGQCLTSSGDVQARHRRAPSQDWVP